MSKHSNFQTTGGRFHYASLVIATTVAVVIGGLTLRGRSFAQRPGQNQNGLQFFPTAHDEYAQLNQPGQSYRAYQQAVRSNGRLYGKLFVDQMSAEQQQQNSVVQKIRKASDKQQKEELVGELEELLGDEFEKIHERQSAEIKRAEERLAELKKVHEQRQENKQRIIERRVNELVGQPDLFNWEYPSQPTPASGFSRTSRAPRATTLFSSPQPFTAPSVLSTSPSNRARTPGIHNQPYPSVPSPATVPGLAPAAQPAPPASVSPVPAVVPRLSGTRFTQPPVASVPSGQPNQSSVRAAMEVLKRYSKENADAEEQREIQDFIQSLQRRNRQSDVPRLPSTTAEDPNANPSVPLPGQSELDPAIAPPVLPPSTNFDEA